MSVPTNKNISIKEFEELCKYRDLVIIQKNPKSIANVIIKNDSK